ncbi:unnamed protein product [Rhizopus stolonifer]
MEGNKIFADVVRDTPFLHTCNTHKERFIPILKDANISDHCKEIGKQILNNTKRPLSQHIDVLIPNKRRDDSEKAKAEQFKRFFGKKYMAATKAENKISYSSLPHLHTTQKQQTHAKSSSSASNIIQEFVKTEESYVNSLQELVTKIMKPLRESINEQRTPILDKYTFNRIFLNIEDILYLNKEFLNSLQAYQSGQSTELFGQICARHIETFDPYKTYFLSKEDSLKAHQQKTKSNRAYSNFIINTKLEENRRINDLLILPIQRMPRYNLLFADILNALEPQDQNVFFLKLASEKAKSINQMQYGSDSPLLPLYTLIKSAPATFVGKRQLLGHFDATELLISSGKIQRPVTIMIFSDKIVVVKRKNYSLQGQMYCENIEEKAKKTNDQPFEFKGWANIWCVELFNGLKDRPETFFLRTNLPEKDPNAPENDADNYFRKSDRLYSLVPTQNAQAPIENFVEKKRQLIDLYQRQVATANLEKSELYHNNGFNIPTFARIYDEDAYREAVCKNNILVVYVENEKVDLNSLLTEDVWIVILVRRENGGFRQKIYSKVSLTPIRDSRDSETELLINDDIRSDGRSLDFIKTLWNNCFFYERKLRATEAYSCVHDGLMRERARTRSRSRSLTRVASNMSVGRLFGARSRSTSPSKSSISTLGNHSQELTIDPSTACVSDPILEVAAMNGNSDRMLRDTQQYSTPPITPVNYAGALDNSTLAKNYYSNYPEADAQPYYRYNDSLGRNTSDMSNDESQMIDSFTHFPLSSREDDILYGHNQHQDNSLRRPLPYHIQRAQYSNFDPRVPHTPSPEPLSRPSTGTSHNSTFSSGAFSSTDPAFPLSNTDSHHMYNSVGSSNSASSVLSYVEDKINEMSLRRPDSYDDRFAHEARYSDKSSPFGKRGSIPPSFYPQPQASQSYQHARYPDNLPPSVGIDKIYQLKDELNSVLDDMIQSQQQMRHQPNARYQNNPLESVRGLRSHIVSKIDEIINSTEHQNQQYVSFR